MYLDRSSPLLGLPFELRMSIYQYVLHDEVDITLGCMPSIDSSGAQSYRLAVKGGYHPALLSTVTDDGHLYSSSEAHELARNVALPTTAHCSLLATCQRIHAELRDNFPKPAQRRTNLFVQYPHGLNLLATVFPHLAYHARSLHITGVYSPPEKTNLHLLQRTPQTTDNGEEGVQGEEEEEAIDRNRNRSPILTSAAAAAKTASAAPSTSPASLPNALTSLLATHFPSSTPECSAPSSSMSLLNLRIFYPGPDGYNTAWTAEDSPVALALRGISTADFRLENWHRGGDDRAEDGGGLVLHVRRSESGERTVRAIWRRWTVAVAVAVEEVGAVGEDGGGGGGEVGRRRRREWWREWLVDPRWPGCEEEYRLPED